MLCNSTPNLTTPTYSLHLFFHLFLPFSTWPLTAPPLLPHLQLYTPRLRRDPHTPERPTQQFTGGRRRGGKAKKGREERHSASISGSKIRKQHSRDGSWRGCVKKRRKEIKTYRRREREEGGEKKRIRDVESDRRKGINKQEKEDEEKKEERVLKKKKTCHFKDSGKQKGKKHEGRGWEKEV